MALAAPEPKIKFLWNKTFTVLELLINSEWWPDTNKNMLKQKYIYDYNLILNPEFIYQAYRGWREAVQRPDPVGAGEGKH
jgi:hypothetical protein